MTTTTTPAPADTKTIIATDVSEIANDLAEGNGLSNFAISSIRTGVPFAIGYGITELATLGVDIPDALRNVIDGGATFVVGLGYYLIVRKLEAKWPTLGWLLGHPAKPVYESAA